MLIIGCDYHPSFQQIAFVDTDTGELQERRLEHREEAEKFYRGLGVQGMRVRVGMEASAHAHWLLPPHALSFLVLRGHGRTVPLPQGAAVAALEVLQCRYPQTQFVGSPGGSHIL